MADGQPVIQGQTGWNSNHAQTSTQLICGGTNQHALYLFAGPGRSDGLYVVAPEDGAGVSSFSYRSHGVVGMSVGSGTGGAGVRGISRSPGGVGIYGWHTDRVGVWGESSIGVVGQSKPDHGIGVEGDAEGRGSIGVFGMSRGDGGVGVYATAPNPSSAGLQVNGRAVFSASGIVVVPAGSSSAVVSGPTLSGAAFALATVQTDAKVAVRAAVPDPVAGTVTVHLTAKAEIDVTVGWMVVN